MGLGFIKINLEFVMLYSLIASLVCNLFLVLSLLYLWRKKPGTAIAPTLTKDANQLLSDLLNRGSVVITQVVDPNDVFLYSPRDRQ